MNQLDTPDVVDTALQNGAATEVTTLGSFLGGLVPFLQTARRLEDRALATFSAASLLTKPTSKEEDEAIVATVRQWNVEAKELTAHWEARGVVFALHKRLIAAFQRAETPQKAAIERATNLHNAWAADERDRVRREEQVKREAEEARQREVRALELAKLEEQAAAAEATSPDLSDREKAFVQFMVSHGDTAAGAAARAGYKNHETMGTTLMQRPKIVAAVDALMAAIALRKQAAAVVAAPLVIEDVTVAPEVAKAADRTTHKAEVFDEGAFLAACLAPGNPHGIPAAALLTVKQAALTEVARQMGAAFNRWPGVRLASTTKIR